MGMHKTTERLLAKMYKYILNYCEATGGTPPTLREIGEHVEMTPQGVRSHLQRFITAGMIRYEDGKMIVAGAEWVPPSVKVGYATALDKVVSLFADHLPEGCILREDEDAYVVSSLRHPSPHYAYCRILKTPLLNGGLAIHLNESAFADSQYPPLQRWLDRVADKLFWVQYGLEDLAH